MSQPGDPADYESSYENEYDAHPDGGGGYSTADSTATESAESSGGFWDRVGEALMGLLGFAATNTLDYGVSAAAGATGPLALGLMALAQQLGIPTPGQALRNYARENPPTGLGPPPAQNPSQSDQGSNPVLAIPSPGTDNPMVQTSTTMDNLAQVMAQPYQNAIGDYLRNRLIPADNNMDNVYDQAYREQILRAFQNMGISV
jgi:hypothetical protein